MPKVNGIPTSEEFRKSVGRYGLRGQMKRNDLEMSLLIRALECAQPYRNSNTKKALFEMRELRKKCILWLYANSTKKRFEKKKIKVLGLAADNQLQVLRNNLLAPATAAIHARGRRATKAANQDNGLTMNGTFGKKVDPSYNIERFSSNHLPGPQVEMSAQQKFQSFKNRFPATRFQIEDFIKHCLIPDSQDDPRGIICFGRTTQSVGLFQRGVKYCTAEERQDYRLNFMGNGIVMYADGWRFDTSGMHSNSAGPGWGIFVVDFNQTFYAGPHAVNEFHHSSFLAGAPVYAAGEIAVRNGKVVGLTNKTGHYKAGPDELYRALALLQRDAGVNLDEVAVNDPFRGQGLWRRGSDVLVVDGDFRSADLRVFPSVPQPAFA